MEANQVTYNIESSLFTQEIIPGLEMEADCNTDKERFNMFYNQITDRMICPKCESAIEDLSNTVNRWREKGKYIGFYTGVFDLTHLNHYFAVVGARIELAKAYAESIGVNYCDLSEGERMEIVNSDKVKLIVSIDGDAYVSSRKGNKHGEVFTERPVQPWIVRATNIKNFMLKTEEGLYRPTVDLVTSHDHISYPDTFFSSHLTLGAFFKPDCWMVASSDLENAMKIRNLNIGTKIMNLKVGSFIDPLTGHCYSTSDSISRLFKANNE
ncbi:MAG: hypothetical protein WCK31_00405 [bacterium]